MQTLCPLFYYANITLSSVPVVFPEKPNCSSVFAENLHRNAVALDKARVCKVFAFGFFLVAFFTPTGSPKKDNPKKENSKTSKTFCNYSATLSEFSNSPVSGFTRTVPDFRQIPLQRFEKYTVRLLATSKASCISFASK